MVLMSIALFNNPSIGANLIMFENITYFFSSQTARTLAQRSRAS